MKNKINPELDRLVIAAMIKTIDAIGFDLQEAYDDGIIPKTDAREMVVDADRIFVFGNMADDVLDYYKNMSKTHRAKLLKKAIPFDLC